MTTDNNIEQDGQFSSRVRTELEKLTSSIDVMMDNLRKMEHPILESRKRLPEANEQLDKISAQTEAATQQVLDMVEQIIEHQEQVVAMSGEFAGFLKKSRSKDRDLATDKINRINELASTSQNNAFLIMDALQFQDITSQQMHHAAALLEEIERRLHHLLGVFDGKELPPDAFLEGEPVKKARAYDPQADMVNSKDQKEVDSIISQVTVANK